MYQNNSEILDHSKGLLASNSLADVRGERRVAMASPGELEQQLAAWNATQQYYPRSAPIPQLVELQAAATSDAPALVAGGQVLSYGELNRRANQLAHHLQNLGVGPNVLVGLCIERSFERITGLLGILKAGGASIPLDPAYPPDRLAFMLEDAQASALVMKQNLVTRLAVQ